MPFNMLSFAVITQDNSFVFDIQKNVGSEFVVKKTDPIQEHRKI